jgi:hypothetical protein
VNRIHTFIIMFAPSPRKCGECLPVVAARYLPTDTHAQFMYLSPTLEKESQKSVNSTIAPRVCARLLGHGGQVTQSDERAGGLLGGNKGARRVA